MRRCSVIRKLQIVRGSFEDYKKLARFHYRDNQPGAYTAIFVIKPVKGGASILRPSGTTKDGSRTPTASQGEARQWGSCGEPVGVIVYTMPSMGAELRNIATGNTFAGFDNQTRLALINRNIRCISRVIIEPRFRGLGLASRLVRETMPEMGVPIVEAMAVMGLVNPFFEKAGMKSFAAKMPVRCIQLVEALSAVGIEGEELIDTEGVQRKIERLGRREGEFVESEIRRFLQSYGKRRYERAGLERTGFVLSKLTFRPVYYIWFNEKIGFKV
jgi:GNAT superfamily N-acetyltransferase